MITRLRESASGKGYTLTVIDDQGVVETREEPNLAKAFAMQKSVQDTGKWPDGKEPKR